MELVWRNDCGSELGRKKYNPDTTDVHEAIGNTDWIFTPGDTITIEREKIDDEVFKYMEEKVNECFLKFQKENDIETGDCDPWDSLRLEEKTKELAEQIVYILKMQMRESDVDEDREPKDDKY